MKGSAALACCLAGAVAVAGAALADEAPSGPAIAFNAAYSSDYIFRGISQTGGKGAASGGADLTYQQFYAGTWLSQVNFGPTAGDPQNKTKMEYDLYAGVRPTVAGFSLDLGVIRYGYTDSPSSAHYAYWEGKILASRAIGPLTVGGAFYYSPEYFGKVGDAEYVELNGAYTFKNKASLSGAVGYENLDKSKAGIDGYTTWNLGVTYPITDHFGIDLRYSDTDDTSRRFYTSNFAGDRLTASLKATF